MSSRTLPAFLALAALAAAALPVGDTTFTATAQLGEYGPTSGEPGGVRLLLEARGGAAADALAVRTPSVERAVDDKGRSLKHYESKPPPWEKDLGYELVPRDVKGIPADATRAVLFLGCPDAKVRTVTVEGTLEMLAGGKDVDLAFKKFESKKMRKLKDSTLSKAGLQIEALTGEVPGLLMVITSSDRDIDELTLLNGSGEWATGLDWSATSSGKDGMMVVPTSKATLPNGMALEIKLEAGAGGAPIALLIKDVRGDKQGRELQDKSLADAGVRVIARMAVRPTLRLRIEGEGERPLLHDLGLEVKGERLEPSDLRLINQGNLDDILWIYDNPWPKGTVLVGKLRKGGEWVKVPFTVADIAME